MSEKPWFAYYEKMGMPRTLAYPPRTPVDYLREAARECPDGAFAICKGAGLSYRELDETSDAFAAALADFGVAKGDRVLLQLPTSLQFLIVQFGIWKAGAVAAPIDPRYTARETRERIRDYDAKIAVVFTPLYNNMKEAQRNTGLARIVSADIPGFLPPHTSLFVSAAWRVLRALKGRNDTRLNGILKTYAGRKVLAAEPGPKDPAVILASSGACGSPKGVEGRHECYVMAGMQLAAWTQPAHGENTRILLPLPLDHVFANLGVQSMALLTRATLVLIPDPRNLADLVHTFRGARPAFFCGVPRLYTVLLDHKEVRCGRVDFSCLQASFCGGSTLKPELKERFERITGTPILQGYSLTEGMMGCVLNPLNGPNKPGSVGMPLPDVDVRIAENGEILLSAPQLASGYWRKPLETSAAFIVQDGMQWLRTGDIGSLDADGYLFITRREKDVMKVGGQQVAFAEVEDVIREHPAVADVIVADVPHPHRDGDSVPKAWVVLKSGQDVHPEDIRSYCREFLAPYKIPRSIEFRRELPRNRLGKEQRWKLKEQETDEEF